MHMRKIYEVVSIYSLQICTDLRLHKRSNTTTMIKPKAIREKLLRLGFLTFSKKPRDFCLSAVLAVI